MTSTAEAPARAAGLAEPDERGRLHINRVVLRKIAEHAADVDASSAREGKKHTAGAEISGPDDGLRVRLSVALRYPASVREAVSSIRTRVNQDLAGFGCKVRSIDVTVTALIPAAGPPRVE
ncbi:Asp23/Gls24 family envelope stress response protein [Saccharopolyspora halophila]|uniref:Asp23/Gls24 family envelope stress response protein n=1 Tax=Saccharopolyspora halophila TaxID=405551 RepID=A0ABN3FZP7_9PSEU